MSSIKIDRPVPYYLQFYTEIKRMIYNQEISPGERINESKLAKELGVSRSPIREAMRLLEKDGLLIADHKLGFVVYSLSVADVENIYQIRIALETLAVESVIQHATDEEIKYIGEQLRHIDTMIEKNEEDDEIISLNQKFHHLIAEYSHNHYLVKQLETIEVLIYYCRVLNFEGKGRANVIQKEHVSIFEQIEKRNSKEAVLKMTEHLKHDLVHLKDVLGES